MLILKRVLLLFIFLRIFLRLFTMYSWLYLYIFRIPGVYPPSIQIQPPIPTGISVGNIGENYNQTNTVIILRYDIGCKISSPHLLQWILGNKYCNECWVNYVTFDIQNLPNGISYQFLILQIVNISLTQMVY